MPHPRRRSRTIRSIIRAMIAVRLYILTILVRRLVALTDEINRRYPDTDTTRRHAAHPTGDTTRGVKVNINLDDWDRYDIERAQHLLNRAGLMSHASNHHHYR